MTTTLTTEPITAMLYFHGGRDCIVIGALHSGADIFMATNQAGRCYLLGRKSQKETAKGYTQAKMLDELDLAKGKVYDAAHALEVLKQIDAHLDNIRRSLTKGERTRDEERGAARHHWLGWAPEEEKRARLLELGDARLGFAKRHGLED